MAQHRIVQKLTAVAAVAVLVGCSNPSGTGGGSSGGGGQAKEGGTLTVGLAEAPDKLDPTVASTYVGRIVFANMCEKLYDVDENLELVPQLAAEMPKISADGKTYTIKLREGVKFNDGTDLDAAAVKKTLDHYRTAPKSARAADLGHVEKVEAVDPTTVKVSLKAPFAPLTSILADRSGMILSPKQLDKLGDEFSKNPVCVGPFQFEARPSSDRIELTKSSHYYDKDKVRLDGVNFTVVTQPNVRAANLRSGDIDLADRIEPAHVETVKNAEGVKVRSVTSLGYDGITFNVSNSNGAGNAPYKTVDTPMAEHPELRQAFALSLDRETINKVVYNGQYVPACTPIPSVNPLAPETECPEQDVAKAKQLVEQSGVQTPVKVELVVQAANSQASKLGTVIQSMAKKAGFQVEVKPTEFTTGLSEARAGSFEAFNVGWSGRIDPDQNIAPFWDPESRNNFSGADYADVQKLIEQERATTDPAKRKEIFAKLNEAFLKHNNIIYFVHPKLILGQRANVTGVEFYGDGLIRLKTAALTG